MIFEDKLVNFFQYFFINSLKAELLNRIFKYAILNFKVCLLLHINELRIIEY